MDNLAFNDVSLALSGRTGSEDLLRGLGDARDPLPYIVFSFLEESLFPPAVMSRGNPDLLLRST